MHSRHQKMRRRHQTRYVALTAMKRCIRELDQAVADFPEPETARDKEMRSACEQALRRLEKAMEEELKQLPE